MMEETETLCPWCSSMGAGERWSTLPNPPMHLLPSLLSFLLMQAAPAAPPQDAFPVSLSASVAGGLSHQGGSYHGQSGVGRLAVDWFVRRPVVDDGTALGLQPYLQRVDRLSLGVEGSLASAKNDASLVDYSDQYVATRLVGLFYHGWSVFGGEVDYTHVIDRQGYATKGRQHIQILRPSATFGVRDQAFELRLSYIHTTYFDSGTFSNPGWGGSNIFTASFEEGSFRNSGWGQGLATMTLVLDASTYFNLTGFTLEAGGGFSAKYETFLNPRLGIWLGGDYQGEEHDSFDGATGTFYTVGYSMARGEIGVEWWRSNRFALLGWISGGMTRGIFKDRSAYGSETPYLELFANLGIVTRLHRHGNATPPAR
jgi:hypothetical protein